jgi:EAL domain-containing protein (putative c-di-GMP-specific phosphodiesterase class I)
VFSTPNEQQRLFVEQSCAVGDRYREIERMRAVESAAQWSDSSRLFFTIAADESTSPHRLLSNLKLQAVLPDGWELGVTLSLPTDVDILRISEIYREARNHSLFVAFDQFQGNGAQVMHLETFPPDYLVLAANMTKDLMSTRQPMRRLESVVAACNELGIKPILPHQVSGNALGLCQEIGFDLILQPPTHRAASQAAALSASH